MRRHDLQLDLRQPRTIPEIVFTTLGVYASYAWLLLPLAALAVVPYEVVVIIVAKTADLGGTSRGHESRLLLLLAAELLVVQPLLAAVQVQTLEIIGAGKRPRLREVLMRTAPVLANVIAAEIVAAILIALGFFLFLIPGIYLLIRLTIVAQAAASERLDWTAALRRSMQLSRGNWWRILGVLIVGAIVNATVETIGGALVSSGVNAGSVIVGIICALLTLSFSSLLSAVLYFDLDARNLRLTRA